MKLSNVLITGLLALACAAVWTAAHATEVKVGGYTQARFYSDGLAKADADKDKFDIRRARVDLRWPVNDEGTAMRLQFDLGKLDDPGNNSVGLSTATITHPLNEQWSVRLGFKEIEFGIDPNYSSSSRLPFERSEVSRALFPGEYETALYFFYKPESPGQPQLAVGYSNDLKDWAGKNNMADMSEQNAYVARLQWPLPNKGFAGASYMRARRAGTDTAATTGLVDTTQGTTASFSNDVFGLHVRYVGDAGLNFQGEYFTGDTKMRDIKGWYGTVEYRPQDSKTSWFYRYDTFDDSAKSTDYSRHTLGAAVDVAKNSRLTLQFEDIDKHGDKGSSYGLQWQVKY